MQPLLSAGIYAELFIVWKNKLVFYFVHLLTRSFFFGFKCLSSASVSRDETLSLPNSLFLYCWTVSSAGGVLLNWEQIVCSVATLLLETAPFGEVVLWRLALAQHTEHLLCFWDSAVLCHLGPLLARLSFSQFLLCVACVLKWRIRETCTEGCGSGVQFVNPCVAVSPLAKLPCSFCRNSPKNYLVSRCYISSCLCKWVWLGH